MVDWDEASKNYVAKISDIENSLLCKRPSSSLENLTLVHENRVDVDVLHFGHLLFEMALGHRLHKSTPCQSVLKNEYEGVNAEISEVLWMIFSPESIRDKNICIEVRGALVFEADVHDLGYLLLTRRVLFAPL